MKKVLSVILAVIMIASVCPIVMAAESLNEHICFTWGWGAKKIDTDNSVTVVSWSGGSTSSYRSSFIVYDLPQGFSYESIKSEVIISFAINKATLNNGEGQAPTAAIVLVNGDKVKEAYALKSGDKAASLLSEAKNGGIYFGKYKIGKYPRTSRIRDAEINEYFEKNKDVKSIGFYVTNIPSDGYSDMVSGIASAMTDFEVNFEYSNNYTNTTVKMVDDKGEVLEEKSVRGSLGSRIDVPDKIEKGDKIWVRDSSENYYLDEAVDNLTVTYHEDGKGREKYAEIIENTVKTMVEGGVKEKIDLPTQYTAEDGFVIKIDWMSEDESIVATDGNVYRGNAEQNVNIYATVWIGKYKNIETGKIPVTVKAVDTGEVEGSLLVNLDFSEKENKRGEFTGEGIEVTALEAEDFTVCAFVRCDDILKGGNIFELGDVCFTAAELGLTEGKWHHIAVTQNAVYVDSVKVKDGDFALRSGSIGSFWGVMDNFRIYTKAFSNAVIGDLSIEEYDRVKIEIINARVVEGMDGVIVKVASSGYVGECSVFAYAEKDGVRFSGHSTKSISEEVNVFSVSVPNMAGGAKCGEVEILLWEGMEPLVEKSRAEDSYSFSFNYEMLDNHLLNNTFTLKNKETGKYLEKNASKRWSAPFETSEGYYSLKNEKGDYISGDWSFIRTEGGYLIKNRDTLCYLSMTGSSIHEKAVADESSIWELGLERVDDVSKVFISEGFFLLSDAERKSLYGATGQALYNSRDRRAKLIEVVGDDYFELDGISQAERLREVFDYSPSYQINRSVNKSTTGVEAEYSLSDITWTSYPDMDGNTKNGYTGEVTYKHPEGDVKVIIYARSQNVVKNIAKGFSYMPYQFIKPLKKVTDYYATNNQFKAETGEVFILTNYEVGVENAAVTGSHELGHLIDFAGYRISIGDYKAAREEECPVSGYGDTALSEDFAEFCQFVISSLGDKEILRQVREMFPGRYDALCKGMCEMYGECILSAE